MARSNTVDIKESNHKRRFFHQTNAMFSKLNQDYPSPGDVLIAMSPEDISHATGGVSTHQLTGHMSDDAAKFGIGVEEASPSYFGESGSYGATMVIHVPGHVDHISASNRENFSILYLTGQEPIVDTAQQFFDLKQQDLNEPPRFIEALHLLPRFLTPKAWMIQPLSGSDPEQLMEGVRHFQMGGDPGILGGIGDAIVSMWPLKDAQPLQEHSQMDVAIAVDSIGHPQALHDIAPVLDPMKPTMPKTEDLNLFSSSMLSIWPEFQRLLQKTESSAKSKERARLLDDLRTAFRQEPFEDGVEHEAEEIIGSTLKDAYALPWLRKFSTDEEDPVFAASVLGCLGRQINPGSKSWRSELIRTALTINNVEVRDAAVVAAHQWGDRELARVLTSHQESVSWLHDYIQVVVRALEE